MAPIYECVYVSLQQGCTTQISWRAKKKFDVPKGQSDVLLLIQRVQLSRKKLWRAKLKASTGHIWPAGRMLCILLYRQSMNKTHKNLRYELRSEMWIDN